MYDAHMNDDTMIINDVEFPTYAPCERRYFDGSDAEYDAYVNETSTLTTLWVLTCTHATEDCDFDAIDHAFMTSADLARHVMCANNIPTE